MSTAFQELFAKYVGTSWIKQLALADVTQNGSASWNVDLASGTITFGECEPQKVSLLGSESSQRNSWLWAWDNKQVNCHPSVLQDSIMLKEYGEIDDIPELTHPELSLQGIDGNILAMVAAGVLNSGSYYSCPTSEAVRVFLLLPNFPVLTEEQQSAARIIRAVSELVGVFAVNHEQLLQGLIDGMEMGSQRKGDALTIITRKGEDLSFKLDQHGRIVEFATLLKP